MMPLHTIRQFFNDMRRQKLRTAMTTFGIFWGTCSIVLLFAFGQGIRENQIESQKGMGENIGIFWPGITAKDYKGLPRGREIRFTEDDAKLIKSKAITIDRISPEFSKWNVSIKVGRLNQIKNIIGVWPEFGEMRNLIALEGTRWLNDQDEAQRRRVIFLGDRLADQLFAGGTLTGGVTDRDDSMAVSTAKKAVGQQVLVNGVPFTVVGIMKPKRQDSSYNGRDAQKAFIPASTFNTMYSRRYPNNMVVQCKPEETMKKSREEILSILGAKYRFDPTDREALSVWDVTEGLEFMNNFFGAFQWFLVGIGVATLITGGIGVSNIMNVVLEERTKEIGIKMALGARKSYVMWQFIVETLMITAIGGIMGFLFAFAIVTVFPALNLEEYIGTPRVNILGGVMVTILLGIVGLIAGIFPARRASNLQPVQALKLF
ncbi:MAG: ABC transporter permease [bacterium]|nr:ABC transporter permease [bacterium]